MENASIQSKVLIIESSEQATESLRTFFNEKGLIGLKGKPQTILDLLKSNTDLGAVFLCQSIKFDGSSGDALAKKIHQLRPELPIFVRQDQVDSNARKSDYCHYYSISEMPALEQLVDSTIFTRFYPTPLILGIKEISEEAFQSSIFDITVSCEPPYLVKDNIIYGELFSLIPLESDWCRGYMMLQTTRKEIVNIISDSKTHLSPTETDFRDVNGLLNEITNLIWGGIRSRFFQSTAETSNSAKTQVPILINHMEKYISFGTNEPQLCFKYTIRDKTKANPSIDIYQKLIFNLDWRPEDFQESTQAVDDLVDSGELEFF
jgi:hypothetical protein